MRFLPMVMMVLLLQGCELIRGVSQDSASVVTEICDSSGTLFGGGDGSVSKPYLICSVSQLQNVSLDLAKNYKLKSNLDLTAVSFAPLGTYANGFSGSFDGDGHSVSHWSYAAANPTDNSGTIEADISNAAVSVHADFAAGFFRTLESGSTVKNLTLNHLTLWGRFYTGGLVGLMKTGSTVSNCHVATDGSLSDVTNTGVTAGIVIGYNDHVTGGTSGHTGGVVGASQVGSLITASSFAGMVRGAMTVGGVVGETFGTVSDSHSSGGVMGRDGNDGGLAGNLAATAVVTRSYSTSTVTETSGNSGGFAGSLNDGAVVTSSYFNGTMIGNSLGTGGFVGYVSGAGSKVSKCYSVGTVTGNGSVGGFVGFVLADGAVEDSYSLANVTSASYAGGFVGGIGDWATLGAISRVYSVGSSVSTGSGAGDLAGHLNAGATVTHSFALDTASGGTLANASDAGSTVVGSSSLSSANLKVQGNFTGWDFTGIWQISSGANNGYPTLR